MSTVEDATDASLSAQPDSRTDDPIAGSLKTEYSPNARSKCQLCRMKICKGAWRVSIAVLDPYHQHSDGRARVNWESSHASCYFDNVTNPVDLTNSTQSMPYSGTHTKSVWSSPHVITFPPSEEAGVISEILLSLNPSHTLQQSLSTPSLQTFYTAAVYQAIPGAETLNENDRNILELFCLHKKLTDISLELLKVSELQEAELQQSADDSGDSLKSKFTQYSPNSMAHCRDCQMLLEQGTVRVGAHVYSSSSRHAGYSINYWCLSCMCARPAVRRMARLYPNEIEKVLPGAELLATADVNRTCTLLGMAIPDPAASATQAQGRIRATRSGRKFNTWGEPVEEAVASIDAASDPTKSKRTRR